MIDIQINDDYKLTSDSLQYIVQKRIQRKDGTKGGWRSVGFYSTEKAAFTDLYARLKRECDATSILEYNQQARAILMELVDALTPTWEIVTHD